MAHIEIGPWRTHRAEGPGGDHVHFLGSPLHAFFPDHIDDFLGVEDYRLAGFDFSLISAIVLATLINPFSAELYRLGLHNILSDPYPQYNC
jgi:hypothetical protein